MERRKFSLAMIGATALAGCGGGSDGFRYPSVANEAPPEPPAPGPNPLVAPEFATPTSLPAGVAFLQSIVGTDGDDAMAPGQANVWDLNTDFSIATGGNDQFNGAMHLTVDVGEALAPFPTDQTYGELTALGPEMNASDGVKAVSFASDAQFSVNGSKYALLHPGTDVCLQQTLNLASTAGHGISLTWTGWPTAISDDHSPGHGHGHDFLLKDPSLFVRVVVRNVAGTLLTTLFKADRDGKQGTWGVASLTAFAGQTVVLSFEQRVMYNGSTIDNVSVKDVETNAEFITNGDFEADDTGWIVPSVKAPQNLRAGVRTLKGLEVQRSFYAQPNLLWARITDEFHNPTAAPIEAVVSYDIHLGSDGLGVIYPTPDAPQKALSAWDYRSNSNGHGDRDIGLVYGAADFVNYRSETALGVGSGSNVLVFKFNLSIPVGSSVTLMNFIIMTGTDTGLSATDITAKATEVDTQAADIANHFRTQLIYQRGLTQAQLDTLKNF